MGIRNDSKLSARDRASHAPEHQRRQQRVASQLVVVVQVLVPQRQPEHALCDQLMHYMLDEIGVSVVGETVGELPQDSGASLRLTQQHSPAV